MPPKRTFAEYMTPEGTPEPSRGHTGSTPPTVITTPPVPTQKRQCHDARARDAKPEHSPDNLFGTVPKKPIIELPRPSRTSAEVRMQLFNEQVCGLSFSRNILHTNLSNTSIRHSEESIFHPTILLFISTTLYCLSLAGQASTHTAFPSKTTS